MDDLTKGTSGQTQPAGTAATAAPAAPAKSAPPAGGMPSAPGIKPVGAMSGPAIKTSESEPTLKEVMAALKRIEEALIKIGAKVGS